MFDTNSEKVVIILGGLSTLFVTSSAYMIGKTSPDINYEILSLVNLFNHFILIVITLPFLLNTLFEQEHTSKAYIILLNAYSALNSIFIIIISLQAAQDGNQRLFFNFIDDQFIFIIMALIELIPVYLTLYLINKKSFNFQ